MEMLASFAGLATDGDNLTHDLNHVRRISYETRFLSKQ
jgi:hypothetical protein